MVADQRQYTLQEIGDHERVTRERIRQIEANALKKVRIRFLLKNITKEHIDHDR